MAWNDLLHELLSIIFLNIVKDNQNLSDLYQCLGVCRLWRQLAKECLFNIAPSPWLMLNQKYPNQSVTFNTTLCEFHNPTKPTPESTLTFRLIDHTKAYACYDGWLLLGYDNKDFRTSTSYLYNPLSGVLLQLPPFPEHLRLDAHGPTPIKFVISETSPTDRGCIICVKFSIRGNSVLAFCKPAPTDDDYGIKGKRCLLSSFSAYWIMLPEKDSSEIEDIIFYRGKFYSIDTFAALYVYNYDSSTDVITSEPVIVEWFNVFNNQKVATGGVSSRNRNCNSLVKSKSGDLLMIKRIFNKNYARVTEDCRVFKLNLSNIDYYHWSEICNLNEEALILGWHDCISISVSEYNPAFKPNCIYFFDKYASGGKVIRYGVYDLKTRNFISYADDNGVDRDPENYKCCRLFAPSGLS